MTVRVVSRVVVLVLVGWGLAGVVNHAHAQLAVFGLSDDAGPEAGPRKLFTNPWRADAGNADGGESGLAGMVRKLKGTGGGGGSSFLKERAPAIAEWMDSDASILPGGKDGGGMSFELPAFGAKLDGGIPDAGPVVKPVVRVARPREQVTPLTSLAVPPGLVWAAVPEAVQQRLPQVWPRREGGKPVPPRYQAWSAEERAKLWSLVAREPGWQEGAPAFLLGEAGRPVKASLVALGTRVDAQRRLWLYAGFAAARDAIQPVNPRVVLAASNNVGDAWPIQPYRTVPGERVRRLVNAWRDRLEVPFGFGKPRPDVVSAVSIRADGGWLTEVHVQEAPHPGGRPPLCFAFTLDGTGRALNQPSWSPVCGWRPVAAVDVDADNLDEMVWMDGENLVLRRYPQGAVIHADPVEGAP